MVQASKKNNILLHKIPLKVTRKEESKKELPKEELPKEETSKEETSKEEILKEEILKEEISKEAASKKTTSIKRKPSIHITFHNPNSEETTTSFLLKILAERLAEDIGKGSYR